MNEIGKILTVWRNKLSETIEAWQSFIRQGHGCFYEDGGPPTQPSLARSLTTIDKVFSDLRVVLSNLEAQAKIVHENRLSVS